MANTGPISGSDLLIFVDGKAVGHSTSCTIDITNETKDMAFKPAASVTTPTTGKWKEKRVSGTSVSIKADGLVFYEETEFGYRFATSKVLLDQTVEVKAKFRTATAGGVGMLSGNFIITSLNISASHGEDITYSISLENSGEVRIDPDSVPTTEDYRGTSRASVK